MGWIGRERSDFGGPDFRSGGQIVNPPGPRGSMGGDDRTPLGPTLDGNLRQVLSPVRETNNTFNDPKRLMVCTYN